MLSSFLAVSRIYNVAYVSPGAVSSLAGGTGQTWVVDSSGLIDSLLAL